MTETSARRPPIGLTLAALAAFAILCALGSWQLQRLAWKTELLEQIETRAQGEPADLWPLLAQTSDPEALAFHRVRATCPGIDQAPFLQLYGLLDGQAGSRLISACRLEGGDYDAILVDRGFVPDTVSARPPVTDDPAGGAAPVEVIGLLRAPEPANFVTPDNRPQENQWFSRDTAAMAQALGATRPAPVFLMAESRTNPDFQALKPSPLPAAIANRHLEYALTWFGLAGALIAVYAAMLWRRWKT
ncbi:MAG TPA: SURF1 family cytochrome oxidase biogenesis protein [Phenylobacterium sp.]|nr:SURF1 family cytochrome oxidase biogenesis protein [Phenylobacterium sp.]HMP62453.1 SURF1 family cytochrome oxidase biogenesis protein [Phenylobacterium sp.]